MQILKRKCLYMKFGFTKSSSFVDFGAVSYDHVTHVLPTYRGACSNGTIPHLNTLSYMLNDSFKFESLNDQ